VVLDVHKQQLDKCVDHDRCCNSLREAVVTLLDVLTTSRRLKAAPLKALYLAPVFDVARIFFPMTFIGRNQAYFSSSSIKAG